MELFCCIDGDWGLGILSHCQACAGQEKGKVALEGTAVQRFCLPPVFPAAALAWTEAADPGVVGHERWYACGSAGPGKCDLFPAGQAAVHGAKILKEVDREMWSAMA